MPDTEFGALFKMTARKDQRLLTQISEATKSYRGTICGCGDTERKEHLPNAESSLVLGLSQ